MCEKCEPRVIDEERARSIQEELLKKEKMLTQDKTSTDTASTDDDDVGKYFFPLTKIELKK